MSKIAKILLSPRNKAYIFLTLTMAIWGVATPVIKLTVGYVPPFTFLAIRFVLSMLVCIPLAIWFLKRYHLDRKRFKHIFISSIIGFTIALSFIFYGLELTTSIEGSLITSFSPLLTSFLAYIILKEVITRRELEGTLIAFTGTLIIIFAPFFQGDNIFHGARFALIGNLLYLTGLFFDSLYAVYMKKNLGRDKIVSPLMNISIAFIIAGILFIPLALFEQYHLYSKTLPVMTDSSKYCTQGDYDKALYIENVTCDDKGCYNTDNKVDKAYETICYKRPENFAFINYLIRSMHIYLAPPAIWGILYMAFLSGIVAYTFYNTGLKLIEASEASLFYYMQPLFGIPIALIFLGESISKVFIIGAILIATGIYITEKRTV